MKTYIDLLLVEDEENTQHLVSAPSHEATPGCIVRFMGGATGTVVKKAWIDDEDETYDLIASIHPIFEAEAIYRPAWKKEEPDAPA
ncbi:MAG: hypothetical protein E7438_03200 [Ruminococcaceae bacterium]|nr:hypothetical protein [Oscillospiraceae bacterium]